MQLRYVVFIMIAGLFLSCNKVDVQETPEAKIYFLIGEVSVNDQPAAIGQVLTENDKLTTGPESSMEMILGPQTGVQLRENSIAEVYYNPVGWQLNVQRGAVLNLVERGTRYHLTSPSAVVAVRGTIYYTHVYSNTEQYICTCNGTIEIDYGNEIKTVSSSHHTPYLVEGDESSAIIQKDVMKEHNDVQIFEFMYRLDEALKSK